MPTFEHGALRLNYTREGAGFPLLFIHGLGGNAENWLLQRRSFAATHDVLAIDLPGHGRSEGREVPFRDYWKAVLDLLDSLEIGRAALCGLSKGGRVGLMFASRHPERVERIAVLNAFVHLTPADRQARLRLYDLLLAGDGGRAWADRLIELMGVGAHASIARGFRRSLGSIDPMHIHARFRELIDFDQRAELADVGCPVMLVRGDQDRFVPDYCIDELSGLLPHSQIVTMPGIGHLPYLEDPVRFDTLLARFLAQGDR